MCAAPDELSFGCSCDTGPRWKILSSFLGAAADFDVRGKMKEEGQRRVSSQCVAGILRYCARPPTA